MDVLTYNNAMALAIELIEQDRLVSGQIREEIQRTYHLDEREARAILTGARSIYYKLTERGA